MSLQLTVRTAILEIYIGNKWLKRGHQLRSNLVNDENNDLLADSHKILNRLKNYCSQLLHVHRASDVRQIRINTSEPLVPDHGRLILKLLLQVEMV
jgi:hypothetical protein